ncbi:hypothetical protein GA0061078_0091 [Bifidobacterium bohemicum]|uniref:Putative replication protein n=1 Tax=Bifidobacterium bohemicum DSM 22767 TaxID=1437606 RepID=A0A086ZFJ9_9BIFI|nr:hypothetical protein [Bifidobacterium bohemicum]KFI45299.1 putative replication protein [Bifidobacterium bohemicum DSM 22767]SCC20019.1 hypothetical protein GA0061078_0091 [Bifidobacterium bohemicum]
MPTLLSHYPEPGGESDIGWQAPTYIVSSGTGLHLYYFLKEPIALTPANAKGLKEFKFALIDMVWNDDTSRLKDKQMQGIYQGFRVVGSASKLGSRFPVTAWHTGPRWTIPELMVGMDIYKRRDLPPLLDRITTPLEEAKEKWPDWYRRRVVDGQEPDRWHVKRDLYDWWVRRLMREGMTYHHRYFCVMALAIYARKCDICEQEMTRDAYRVWERMRQAPDYREHPFTEDDLHAALTAWRDQYCTFPRDTIASMTAKPMTPNRRNHRKQTVHLARARAVQNIDDPEGKWRGRPVGSGNKKQLVRDYVQNHPDASPTQIARELGISRPTVYKYM